VAQPIRPRALLRAPAISAQKKEAHIVRLGPELVAEDAGFLTPSMDSRQRNPGAGAIPEVHIGYAPAQGVPAGRRGGAAAFPASGLLHQQA